jgi:uncharacterized protein
MPTDDPKLDETIEESFPASDPPANTVETGIVPEGVPQADEITDNVAERRLELTTRGSTAFLAYERTPASFTILHTEVPREFRGGGVGGRLVEAAVASAHAAGLRLVVVCPFARAYLHRHPRA